MKITYPIIKDAIIVVVIAYFAFGGASTRHNIKSLKHDIKAFKTEIKELEDGINKIELKDPEQIIINNWNSDIDSTAADSIIARFRKRMSEN